MSTILNTLKKLEEEKSVLEKNIDLKGLLLHGQESVYPQVIERGSRKWGTIGVLIIGGVLLGGLMVYFFNSSKTTLPKIKPSFVLKPSSPAPEEKKPLAQAKTSPGFPLARIPEIVPRATTPDAMIDPMKDDDFFGPEDALILPVETTSPDIAESGPEGSEEIREIQSLIQTATETSGIGSQGFEEIPTFAPNNPQNIPGLKVKGIIFLNSDNPFNHIFVSTSNEKNRKLKVGETLLTATLEAIEAQKAVFSYQGQRVTITIGE
jgi:hypothetical protein